MVVLIITNRKDVTADFVVLELKRRGVDFVRLNTEDIPTRVKLFWSSDIAGSYINVLNRHIELEAIASVWYRRPVSPVPSKDIQDSVVRQFVSQESSFAFGGILRSLDCLWVSHPDAIKAASYKITQLSLAQKIGFLVPATIVTDIPPKVNDFLAKIQEVIYKPVRAGRLEYPDKDKLIFTNYIDKTNPPPITDVELAPCQFQQFIEKEADIRVTVIDQNLFAALIDSQEIPESQVDWRRTDAFKLHHSVFNLPPEIHAKCLLLVKKLNLKFGAIDLVLSKTGDFYFLEINPNGQWAWIEQVTKLPLTEALVNLLTQSRK